MTDEQNWVRIERVLEAPIDTVWQMWTDPDLFRAWYGPKGFSVPVAEMVLKVGGVRKICMQMQAPDRTISMWFTGVFKELAAPNRLHYTESMCDPDGNLLSPAEMGMPPGTPDITEVIVDLTERNGSTIMVMTHVGVPAGSAGEGGWTQAFNKLAGRLAAIARDRSA